MAKGIRYSEDFKKQIVRLYESDKQVSVISSEYEISIPTVYKWINESKTTGSFRANDHLTDEQRELRASRKRIAELEMENNILIDSFIANEKALAIANAREFVKRKFNYRMCTLS